MTQSTAQRHTRQRAAILGALALADGPLSPQQIWSMAHDRATQLGIATVYRNLKHLLHEGIVQPVALPNGSLRYELFDDRHHHHFVCSACDRVFDVPADCSTMHQCLPAGFAVERHDVVLFGTCPGCSHAVC